MKLSTSLCLLAASGVANAHFLFPWLISDGEETGEWEYVRRTANKWTSEGVTSVSDPNIRCYEEPGRPIPKIRDVKAGEQIGFRISDVINHWGPTLAYMAKVPSGESADSWDGSGNVWFKVFASEPEISGRDWKWPAMGTEKVLFDIPAGVPDGEYLVRVEQIALHDAGYSGGAQFYLACGQVKVSGGGSGSPGPLAAFPGAYSSNDPGILIDLNDNPPSSYEMPGPALWEG